MSSSGLLLIFCSVGLSALAQVLLKFGVAPTGDPQSIGTDIVRSYLSVFASPFTIAGLAAYGASALLWLRVLATVPLSQAYPFVALGFVLTFAAGVLIFGEPVTPTRVLGTALILAGVSLVGSH